MARHLRHPLGGRQQLGGYGDVCVLDMGEAIPIEDLAASMITMSGRIPGVEIPIVYTGLRPGEKLDEILWEEGSRVGPTSAPDIRVVIEPDESSPEQFQDVVDRLIDAASREDARVLRLLAECIPSATLTAPPQPWSGRVDPARPARTLSSAP